MAIAFQLSDEDRRNFDVVNEGEYPFQVIRCIERTRDFELHLQLHKDGKLFLIRDYLALVKKQIWKFKHFWLSVNKPEMLQLDSWESSDFLYQKGRLLTTVGIYYGRPVTDVVNYI